MKSFEEIMKLQDMGELEFYLDYYIMIDEVLKKRGIKKPLHTKELQQIKQRYEMIKKELSEA